MFPMKIGIAGYMGSGKSTCARFLARKNNAAVWDTDAIAREMMNNDREIKKKLASCFGPSIMDGDALQFTVLGTVAFSSLENLKQLNRIVHPRLIALLGEKISGAENSAWVLDAALIPLWHIEKWFDILIWVRSGFEIRLKRLVSKKTLPEDIFIKRMLLQEELMPEPVSGKWSIITNDSEYKELEEAMENVLSRYENR